MNHVIVACRNFVSENILSAILAFQRPLVRTDCTNRTFIIMANNNPSQGRNDDQQPSTSRDTGISCDSEEIRQWLNSETVMSVDDKTWIYKPVILSHDEKFRPCVSEYPFKESVSTKFLILLAYDNLAICNFDKIHNFLPKICRVGGSTEISKVIMRFLCV